MLTGKFKIIVFCGFNQIIMAAKSPTVSLKFREVIGVEQFSQRREVFDKPDVDYVPLPSPTTPLPSYREVEPIITSNHGKTTTNFKRNGPGYSSMRESKTDERTYDFRPRKYSDNFTSELNQSDDVDYRHSMTERTRRLSKMRKDFMSSNLHEPSTSPLYRGGARASMPTNSTSPIKYKIESPNLYKFPFAEPYLTPTPVRKVRVDLDSSETNGEQNDTPDTTENTCTNNHSPSKVDHQKIFEDLVKRYSPQRKPIDWTIPPTRPRVIGSVPKSTSSGAESVDSVEKTNVNDKSEKSGEDDVFDKSENNLEIVEIATVTNGTIENKIEPNAVENGPQTLTNVANDDDSKISESELEEKNDRVPELSSLQRQTSHDRKPLEVIDLTIPKLIEKMTAEGEDLENHKKAPNKLKRKRSFLDKLLGRNKNK